MTGFVKMWDAEGGYGFLTPLIGRPTEVDEVFCHHTAILGRTPEDRGGGLPAGTEVDFILVRSDGPSGVQAANVRIKKLKSDVLLKNFERKSPS